ncbi:hypothetical protein BO85DRAFT_151409 [Aspergillus piperis CBS 112811]|uniref:Glycosyltransferase family 69 protein n=1 Tax=Aspergillus piperis CBS 112811 TaxID=1448313 RepID=A0A8G1QU80_9EURO|nr:hypothetical protein BO85DRAFT_151409 [Aspergillus piperis CBS 112811]RAH53748.1 hypothetical protein BO85DRAFT_151409 [Aspergillus piperis CBS 112811]
MVRSPLRPLEYSRMSPRFSVDSIALLSVSDLEEEDLITHRRATGRRLPFFRKLSLGAILFYPRRSLYCGNRRIIPRRFGGLVRLVIGFLILLVALTGILWPSYTYLPPHYQLLHQQASRSGITGRGNPHNETVFIAAILYDPDGKLANGRWGHDLLHLINLLGEENVFLSLYENGSGIRGQSALRDLEDRLPCNTSIQIELDLDLTAFPTVTIPGGGERVKRTDYLAEMRNRALWPLDEHPGIVFDKILYLNDVIFDPIDVLHLLFSTNVDENGVAQYRAACAVDFINAFKFYDTYATRDLEGYGIGLQFFPWFTSAGLGSSRKDVLEGKDAVRVRSCWGGMVAFDAKYFQRRDHPVRFRADPDLFYDGSECCIIHADIQDPPLDHTETADTGIYMNPFVRVAYDERSHSWLWATRRFEKLYPLVHNIANHLAGLPRHNPRRSEIPGQLVRDTVWVPDATDARGGAFREVDRVAGNDGFCADGFGGYRGLSVIVENRQPGQDGWEDIPVPSL